MRTGRVSKPRDESIKESEPQHHKMPRGRKRTREGGREGERRPAFIKFSFRYEQKL
jgi:hypothetical protein